jgi:hypothetical protein
MTPPRDHVNTSNRDRNIITSTKGGPAMTTRHRHLVPVPGCRPARPLDTDGTPLDTDGTPARLTATAAAELAARAVDELAALAEFGHERAEAQRAALERGDLVTTVRVSMELGPVLCTLATSLGELHVLMDQAANTPGGES